mmetsp:Transcript_104609/g.293145  ORF Transcript_104609/g.293145 Transcript_104609/m.293145 type:complete len:206 (-) Transcript_104609:90-707(-)
MAAANFPRRSSNSSLNRSMRLKRSKSMALTTSSSLESRGSCSALHNSSAFPGQASMSAPILRTWSSKARDNAPSAPLRASRDSATAASKLWARSSQPETRPLSASTTAPSFASAAATAASTMALEAPSSLHLASMALIRLSKVPCAVAISWLKSDCHCGSVMPTSSYCFDNRSLNERSRAERREPWPEHWEPISSMASCWLSKLF